MIKIAVDASTLHGQRTGVANYIYEILIRLVKNKDWEFILYSNQEIVFDQSDNVRFEVQRPYRKGPAWLNTQVIQQLKQDDPDLFWGGNGYLPIWLPKKTASLVTIHDLVYLYAGHTMPLVSRLSRRILQPLAVKQATKVVAVSEYTASEIDLHYRRKPDTIINPQVINYQVADITAVESVRHFFDLPERYLLVLGTLEPRKNLNALVKAYIKVRETGLELPILVIAGGKGWLDGELPAIIDQGVKSGFINKLGFVPSDYMEGLYSGAEAFIFPSIHEGFGMPILEAQLCGTPALISNSRSLDEACGNVASRFLPTEDGIVKILIDYACQNVPLVCRLRNTINNDPNAAARKMSELFVQAIEMKSKSK